MSRLSDEVERLQYERSCPVRLHRLALRSSRAECERIAAELAGGGPTSDEALVSEEGSRARRAEKRVKELEAEIDAFRK